MTAAKTDALGRLLAAGRARFLYDGTDLIAEYDASGALVRRYVHGPGVDEPLVAYDGAGTGSRRWLLADERGSVIGSADAAGSVASTAFDDDGQGAPVSRFGFTGQAWLPEAGVYHFKARAYSPRLGRFLQPDPSADPDSPSLYAYAGNDPVNATDPSGEVVKEVVVTALRGGFGGGAGGGSGDGSGGANDPRNGTTVAEVEVTKRRPVPTPTPKRRTLTSLQSHQYDDTYKVCKEGTKCTQDKVFSCLLQNPAPGVSGPPVHDGSKAYVPLLGGIQVSVSPSTRTIVNSTLPGHHLMPGYVIRSVVKDNGGNIGVNNSGYGNGPAGALNSALAPLIWSIQTLAVTACIAAGK